MGLWFMCYLPCQELAAQNLYPIKKDAQWGLINGDGEIVLQPAYDAIGEFKKYGYSVMQRDGGVGLLNQRAEEIIKPKYQDLKVLDSTLIAVMDQAQWMVINLKEEVVLEKGYERVFIWEGQYLAYQKLDKWGIADISGKKICDPQYDLINLLESDHFQTKLAGRFGLISLSGETILEPQFDEVKVYDEELFFFKEGRKWGAVNASGEVLIDAHFDHFQKVGENFIKLTKQGNKFLYSKIAQAIISKDEFSEFYSFKPEQVLVKKLRRLGLLDAKGELILTPQYHEIHSYTEGIYRAKKESKWGLVKKGDQVILDFEYEFIAPSKSGVAIVRKDKKFGLVNMDGSELVEAKYAKIEVDGNQVKAMQGNELKIFALDDAGELQDENEFKKHMTIKIGKRDQRNMVRRTPTWADDNLRLENFEWFYEPSVDKWGLRSLDDMSVVIEPTYHWINIERAYGFTVVGIETMQYLRLDRTEFRVEMVYGLVNNDVGKLTTFVNLWDIRFSDFEKGMPVARTIFDSGRHGLITRKGKIIAKDMAYIGDFNDGIARYSPKGTLTGREKVKEHKLDNVNEYWSNMMAPYLMTSYTTFDRNLHSSGNLTCDDCHWGYIDTLGQIIAPATYDFARDFVNQVGIVECDKKWGVLDNKGKILVPCDYDGINFLENTSNEILQIFINRQKYGLIDTLGQMTVSLMYDEIGAFSNNRLAVKKANKWGFVNKNGFEIIPCVYDKVRNFNEGFATVKYKNKWGLINKNGNVIFDFKYPQLGNASGGLVWFGDSLGKGYKNLEGNTVINSDYQKAEDFSNGVARVKMKGQYGLIDKSGKFVCRPKYISIKAFNDHGLAKVKYGGDKQKAGYINNKGQLINSAPFKLLGEYQEDMVSFRLKDKYGFMNTDGDIVIDPIYSKVSSFSEGMAMVQQKGKCGYINLQGTQIIPCEFSKCLDFKEDKAVVYKGYKKAGLIDRDGKFIIKPGLNKLLSFEKGRGLVRENEYKFYYITDQARLYEGYYQKASTFKHGVAVVQINGKWGVINQKGIQIIPPKYDKISSFEDGYAKVLINEFSGLTNLKGELIVDPDYEYISYAGEGLFRVEKGDKIGYFDKKGKWVWGLQK